MRPRMDSDLKAAKLIYKTSNNQNKIFDMKIENNRIILESSKSNKPHKCRASSSSPYSRMDMNSYDHLLKAPQLMKLGKTFPASGRSQVLKARRHTKS